MKWILGIVTGVLAVVGLAVAPAQAQYPVGSPTVTTSSATPSPGSQVTLTVAGWCAGATVTFASGGQTLATAVADGSGRTTVTVTAPSTVGPFVVAATSAGACVASASVSMAVLADTALPEAGANRVVERLAMGGVAVAIGGGLVLIAALRRRRVALA